MSGHDPCPMCGKPRGYMMQTHNDMYDQLALPHLLTDA
jgi:hypothetical protein